jgi:hypothetical protein
MTSARRRTLTHEQNRGSASARPTQWLVKCISMTRTPLEQTAWCRRLSSPSAMSKTGSSSSADETVASASCPAAA